METREFKEGAKRAASYLSQAGFNVPHTLILESLSRAFGARNWSTLSAQLESLQSSKPLPSPKLVAISRYVREVPEGLLTACEFGGDASEHLKAFTTLCQGFEEDGFIVLCRAYPSRGSWVGYRYQLKQVLPVLYAQFVMEMRESFNDARSLLIRGLEDQGFALALLHEADVSDMPGPSEHHEVCARVAAIAMMPGRLVEPVREDFIQDLIEDVQRRASKYEFATSGEVRSLRLLRESASLLGYDDVCDAEFKIAASRLN